MKSEGASQVFSKCWFFLFPASFHILKLEPSGCRAPPWGVGPGGGQGISPERLARERFRSPFSLSSWVSIRALLGKVLSANQCPLLRRSQSRSLGESRSSEMAQREAWGVWAAHRVLCLFGWSHWPVSYTHGFPC